MLSLSGELGSSASPRGTPSASRSSPGPLPGVLTEGVGCSWRPKRGSRVVTGIDKGMDVDSGRSWLELRLSVGSGGSAKTGESGGGSRSRAFKMPDSPAGGGGNGEEEGCGDAAHLYP